MTERGAALIEALIVTLTAALVGAVAMQAIAGLPERAAKWEEGAAARQRLRTLESRVARLVSRARPIEIEAGGAVVTVPAVWPRRLGLWRPGSPADVSSRDLTFLSRADGHRAVTLTSGLSAAGGDVTVDAGEGCGADPACGIRAGDLVLAVAADGACGLFRVASSGARWAFVPLMPEGAPSFPAASVLVPVTLDVLTFEADDKVLRRYDGYRSDNVMIDGVREVAFTLVGAPGAPLGDGPFIGGGLMAYDIDQRQVRRIVASVALDAPQPVALAPGAAFEWKVLGWP